MHADNCRRQASIRARPHTYCFGLLFCGASDDVKLGIKITGREHNIDVVGIVWQAGSQSASMFYACLTQCLFHRGIPDKDSNAEVCQLRYFLRVLFKDDECVAASQKVADQV